MWMWAEERQKSDSHGEKTGTGRQSKKHSRWTDGRGAQGKEKHLRLHPFSRHSCWHSESASFATVFVKRMIKMASALNLRPKELIAHRTGCLGRTGQSIHRRLKTNLLHVVGGRWCAVVTPEGNGQKEKKITACCYLMELSDQLYVTKFSDILQVSDTPRGWSSWTKSFSWWGLAIKPYCLGWGNTWWHLGSRHQMQCQWFYIAARQTPVWPCLTPEGTLCIWKGCDQTWIWQGELKNCLVWRGKSGSARKPQMQPGLKMSSASYIFKPFSGLSSVMLANSEYDMKQKRCGTVECLCV